MIAVARNHGRTLALAEWLRGLAAGGCVLSLEGERVVRGAAVQMTLADDLEVVRVEAPTVRSAPMVVATHRSGRRFVVPCGSAELAERLFLMATEEDAA